ncbi:hypothetical protein ACLB2K_030179 [Fragaria x ananassa]
MLCLLEVCEDIPQVLDSDVPGLPESPINIFLPILLKLFQSPHSSLRKLSLGSVNQYIVLMPAALYASMDQYLQGLFVLANDPSSEVRKLVLYVNDFVVRGALCSDGNLIDIPVQVENLACLYYHVAFFTTRKVDAYEELTWDYGLHFEYHPFEAFQCICGSELCRDKRQEGWCTPSSLLIFRDKCDWHLLL